MEKQISKLQKFYIGKTIKHNGQIGTVKNVQMMATVMLEVEFSNRTAILMLKEIELATPSQTEGVSAFAL